MIYRIHFVLAALLVGAAISPAAEAWGAAGHQATGALADRLLAGTHAAKEVKRILGLDLRTASLWADCAKGVSQSNGVFTYRTSANYPECRVFESAAGQAHMVDYVKRNWSACRPAAGDDPCHKQYHYTDVDIERQAYTKQDAGTNDHDLISALGAAIAVLQGKAAPAPFDIKDKEEALLILAHYVGDVHQPLHVGAIYLDASGHEVDADAAPWDPATSTRGGNQLLDGTQRLHAEWDNVPTSLDADQLGKSGVVRARVVARTAGSVTDWPTAWASETLQASHQAFKDLSFGSEAAAAHTWPVTLPANYAARRTAIQRTQLIRAGARLAQLLRAIFP